MASPRSRTARYTREYTHAQSKTRPASAKIDHIFSRVRAQQVVAPGASAFVLDPPRTMKQKRDRGRGGGSYRRKGLQIRFGEKPKWKFACDGGRNRVEKRERERKEQERERGRGRESLSKREGWLLAWKPLETQKWLLSTVPILSRKCRQIDGSSAALQKIFPRAGKVGYVARSRSSRLFLLICISRLIC